MSTEKKTRITELKRDIYQIWAERPGSHVYLIKGRTKNVLIDTGLADQFPYLVSCLQEIGLAPSDIHLIVLTHEHFDHVGACVHFYDTAVISAHRLAANKIELQDEFVMMNRFFDRNMELFRADIWLEGDTVIELGNYRLQIIHTPGHCSGCICLYEPDEEILFTGDTVLAGGVLSGIFGSGSISDYVHTLKRLGNLRIRAFYPGHGRVSTTPREDLQMAVRNAQSLLEESRLLFETLDTKATFKRLFSAVRKFPLPSKKEM